MESYRITGETNLIQRKHLWIVLLIALVISIYLNHINTRRFNSIQEFVTGKTPTNIHLGWASDDIAHTMTISWKTQQNASSVVYYDTKPQGGAIGSYVYFVKGSTHSDTRIPDAYHHDIELAGLQPDKVYYFICGEPENWSQEMRFKTGSVTASNTRFIVTGDSYSNLTVRDTLSRNFAARSPEFVLASGDFVSRWNDHYSWDNFFYHVENILKTPEGFCIPMIPCIGNHDVTGPAPVSNYDYTSWYERFELPRNEQWYSLDWGPDIHIIILNSEQSTNIEQTTWLADDLSAHKDTLWKIVMFHRNVVPSNLYAPDWGALNYWVPLFDQYHVDIVFQGHCHYYTRSKPLLDATTPVEGYDNGTIYVITAGWGSELYPLYESTWVESSTRDYHYTLVDVYLNGSLRLEAMDYKENLIDKVWLYKIEHSPP